MALRSFVRVTVDASLPRYLIPDTSVSKPARVLSSCFSRVDRDARILLLSVPDLSIAFLKLASSSSESSLACAESEIRSHMQQQISTYRHCYILSPSFMLLSQPSNVPISLLLQVV